MPHYKCIIYILECFVGQDILYNDKIGLTEGINLIIMIERKGNNSTISI